MRISDWSSDVCSSDLRIRLRRAGVHQIHFVWVLMRKRNRSGYLSRRTIRPYGGRVGRFCRATQRLPDFQHQFIGEVAAGDLLPTDDSVDEINGIVVGRKGHQYAAIEYFHAALIDEFGFEAD